MLNHLVSKWVSLALICGIWSIAGVSQAVAQSKPSSRSKSKKSIRNRPTVSPYLSLIDNGDGGDGGGSVAGGSGMATSYYNIVRPIQQAQKTNRILTNQLNSVEKSVQTLQSPQNQRTDTEAISSGRMRPTGHVTSFENLGGYFPGPSRSR